MNLIRKIIGRLRWLLAVLAIYALASLSLSLADPVHDIIRPDGRIDPVVGVVLALVLGLRLLVLFVVLPLGVYRVGTTVLERGANMTDVRTESGSGQGQAAARSGPTR